MTTHESDLQTKPITGVMDSDSFVIHVDNCASTCVSNDINHFVLVIDTLHSHYIKATGGNHIKVHGKGMIRWSIQDNSGTVHPIYIKDALFVPEATVCLLSPQHWGQFVQDHHPKRDGMWCKTVSEQCILYWDQERYQCTLKYDPIANVTRFRSAPGTIAYQILSALMNIKEGMEDFRKVSFEASIDQECKDTMPPL
eukprot:5255265-Ditylum_brightwellii.AAC.1